MVNEGRSASPDAIRRMILDEARELGFELAGITTPDPPPHLEVFQRWVRHGRHGEMGYLASAHGERARANPRELLPECQSILVLGMNHRPASEPPPGGARVAAYALGDDYHQVIPDRLAILMERLERWLGRSVPHRIYTDTGPILERELAQRAGLGWIGKNTCLIHPRQGSYFFLAEVLLGLRLPADEPITADHCGSCTRCLEACPTRCILPDRTLDARRCISYLTIEHRSAIPLELRPAIGDWVFGCDVCQQVCPWNQRFSRPTDEPTFQPRELLARASLQDFLTLGDRDYRQLLRGSPLKRAKRPGLVRNAAVVAGNQRRRDTVAPLRQVLQADPEPLARRHAAWALGQIDADAAREALAAARALESVDVVREEIEAALRRHGADRSDDG